MGFTYRTTIPQAIKAIHEGAKTGVRQVATNLEKQAAADCPVETGALQASIYQLTSDGSTKSSSAPSSSPDGHWSVEPPSAPSSDQEAIVAYAAYYALFVHDGHHTRSGSMVAGQPWFLAAFNSVSGSAGNTIGQSIAQALAGVALPAEG